LAPAVLRTLVPAAFNGQEVIVDYFGLAAPLATCTIEDAVWRGAFA
jgi:hypothetical protein